MTQESPLWMQNVDYSAREDRQIIAAEWSREGVINGCVATQRAAGANMSVDVSVGRGIIDGDDQTNQGSYLVICTAAENVIVGAAPGSNSRIDLLYWAVNDPNATGPAGDNSGFAIAAGTASADPEPPALPDSAIAIAYITVATGTVSITDAMITDARTKALRRGQTPPGVPQPYFGDEASIPPDFLLCDGSVFDEVEFFGLARALGSSTLPDLRGRTLFGLDNMGGSDAGRLSVANTLGASGGSATHALTEAELAVHTHDIGSHTHPIDHNHPADNTGAGTAHTHDIDHNHGSVSTSSVADHDHAIKYKTGAINTPNDYAIVRPYSSTSGVSAPSAGGVGPGGAHSHTVDLPALGATNSGSESSHTHSVNLPNFEGDSGAPSTANTGNGGGGSAHNNMPPYLLCNWIIAT